MELSPLSDFFKKILFFKDTFFKRYFFLKILFLKDTFFKKDSLF